MSQECDMKISFKKITVAIIFFAAVFSRSSVAEILGDVRLNNYTSVTLIVLVQTETYYGKQWSEIGVLPPKSYAVVSLPNNVLVGAQAVDKSVTYEPVRVQYDYDRRFVINFR